MRYHHGAAGSTQDATPYLDFKPVGSCTRLAQVGVGGVSEDEVPGAMDEEDEVVKVVPTYCLQRLQGATSVRDAKAKPRSVGTVPSTSKQRHPKAMCGRSCSE